MLFYLYLQEILEDKLKHKNVSMSYYLVFK